ncbi:class I SAM-dependent methyltransferase [Paenibacillus allorhizosphaerae]|uniref:2-methoxy-6-polyprenyl-1,4-benzoquinol methylase, mitochondrial n=1 Tax=Paenibacillus allorhizosphaerae TaxID=2849866 RepID=A0ABM8VFZ9_9BACL|nr:class I SAM-dependent methyltransferase [Paenibacillus allorhizosphaerae]CAG7636679.1 2-methoxy-6-polyprenyl-1,4-benzoquinol methylase, mitochondrial [Paenibacillus allorhizosphaerae]
MNQSVKKLFDAIAGEYDRQRKQLIPCFDDFYGMALSLVETDNTAPRILDLGAGTGLFSGMVLQKYPNAKLTLMDVSDQMLEGARRRFAQNDSIRYIVGDYSEYPFAEKYDIVISSLSIHHLTHPAKRQLFAAVYRLLIEGGVFVNADQVEGNHPHTDRYYRQRWLTSIHDSGLAKEAIDASIERRKLDINAKVSDQIAWMEQAGFDEVDCMYKYLDFAVFYGRKK